MTDTIVTYPFVRRVSHRLLGDMLRMTLAETLHYDLTLEEGRTLSRAFTAVAHDYRRTDFLDERRKSIEAWAGFCAA